MGLWIAIGAAALVVAGALFWFLNREKPIEVTVATASAMPATGAGTSVLDATGYVTARRQATVSAKITGKVQDVRIEEGQRVEAGEILATLDDSEARVDLQLRRAQVAAARAQLAEAEAGSANAEREYKRQQEVAALKLTSASALDAARTEAEASRARTSSQASAVRVAQEAQQAAQVQLDNTIVRAPFTGVVTVKAAQPGEMISPISAGGGSTRTGIGTIVDMDSLEIQVDVSEAYINRVQAGPDGRGGPQRLSGLEDTRFRDRHRARRPIAPRRRSRCASRSGSRMSRIVPEMGVRVAFLEANAVGRQRAAPRAACWFRLRRFGRMTARTWCSWCGTVVPSGARSRSGGTLGDDRQVQAGVSAGDAVIVEAPPTLEDGDAVQERETGSMTDAMVEVRNVHKSYVRGKQTVEVLHGLTLDIPKGDFVALMGPSGSGKTTLLNLIGGLDQPDLGRDPGRRRAHRPAPRRQARRMARAQRRLRVPVLQPDAGADRASGTSSCRCC